MNRNAFENLIDEVIQDLPVEFRDRLKNIAILVEDRPSAELMKRMGLSPKDVLLGLYEGVPLTQRRFFEAPLHPDRILIFQEPIEQVCDSPEEIRSELKTTIVHEIAHFFGMDDEYLARLGY